MYVGTLPDILDPEAVQLLNTTSFPPTVLFHDAITTLENCNLVPSANFIIRL